MKISVALCTYNGEAFIENQLKSIAEQTVKPFEIVICDDGSTDQTVEKIYSMQVSILIPISIHINKVSLGVVQNFAQCISLCCGDYILLCDQDDVWYPNKVEKLMQKMIQIETEYSTRTPVLVHSDLEVVDSSCNKLASSFFSLQNIDNVVPALPTLLVQNFVTGCTCMINRSLINHALPIPDTAIMHDWWLALVASSVGCIAFVPECTVKYRQHGNNAVGAKGFLSIHSMRKAIRWNALNRQLTNKVLQAEALENHLKSNSASMPEVLLAYNGAMRASLVSRISTVFRYHIFMQGIVKNLWFFFLLLVGQYKRHLRSKKM